MTNLAKSRRWRDGRNRGLSPFYFRVMEARGLSRKDLEPFLGPRGRVSDILNRTRPMTLEMIRRLADGLGLPAEVLIKPYPLRQTDDHLAAA